MNSESALNNRQFFDFFDYCDVSPVHELEGDVFNNTVSFQISIGVSMGAKPSSHRTDALFINRLDELINLKHSLVRLAGLIDWTEIERTFTVSFTSGRGRHALSPRLVAGLHHLQHTFDASDETVIASSVDRVIVDTTVMPKAIAHPTDSRLLEKSRQHLVKVAEEYNIALR